MRAESGIGSRWELLENALGKNIKRDFSAYGWYKDDDIKVSRDEHWCGWWNDCFEFITMWPLSANGARMSDTVEKIFTEHGYTIDHGIINNGISVLYKTMTAEESHEKARQNLLNGGRMSD